MRVRAQAPLARGICAFVLVALPGGAMAQEPGRVSDIELPAPYEDPERAVVVLDALALTAPVDADLQLARAREYVALAVLSPEREGTLQLLESSVEAARAAVALDDGRAAAHYWLAVTLGLSADHEDGRARIALAREAHAATQRTLELDPMHGGAAHVLGRLHAGARSLGWLNRVIARGLGLGEILNQASWESAERYLRFAAERDPDVWVHHYELGKLLIRTGSAIEGRAVLEDLASRTPRHALDAHYVEAACRALAASPPTAPR